jgi:hypothetical protein
MGNILSFPLFPFAIFHKPFVTSPKSTHILPPLSPHAFPIANVYYSFDMKTYLISFFLTNKQ